MASKRTYTGKQYAGRGGALQSGRMSAGFEWRKLVSQYSAINVPQNTEGLKSVRNVFKQLKSTMVERITGQQVSDKEIAYENLADTLYQRGAQKKSESISNKVFTTNICLWNLHRIQTISKKIKHLKHKRRSSLIYA